MAKYIIKTYSKKSLYLTEYSNWSYDIHRAKKFDDINEAKLAARHYNVALVIKCIEPDLTDLITESLGNLDKSNIRF